MGHPAHHRADDADVYMDLAERDANSIHEPYERADAFICVGRAHVAAGRLDKAAEVLGTITELHRGVRGRARMELNVALTALVTMFPTLRLADPDTEPDWNPHTVAGGLNSLSVVW
ncbi:hypothetical protein ACFQ1S_42810 [Kibdelosporangium lantanae]|uniref:Tetratricopeptide repeat protein n=1 Tax=Kibdelosporangium lantanae TaxID=1497396 RepID=A0ABW3MR62_9PSEU